MSLLKIRRERQDGLKGPRRPPNTWKLIIGLAMLAILAWYLGQW